MLGYEDAEFPNRFESWESHLHPDDKTAVLETLHAHLDGKTPLYETTYRLLCKDGHYRWISSRGKAHFDKRGKAVRIAGFHTDITRQKAMEEALGESESRYRHLFENNKAVELLIDPADGRIVDANQAALTFYGYTKESLTAMSIAQINTLSPEEVKAEMTLAKTEKRNHFNFRHRLSDGRIRDVEVHSGPFSFQGKSLLYSIVHDITARKEAQRALLKSEELLRKAQQVGHIGHWEMDLRHDNLYWSDETFRIFGLIPQSFSVTYETFMRYVHPDDREMVNHAFTDTLKQQRPYHIVHRIVRPDGTLRYVEERGEHEIAKGKVVRSVGTIHDITDRIRLEQAIKEHGTYVQRILDAQPNIVFVTDGNDVKACNQSFLDFFHVESLGEYQDLVEGIETRFIPGEDFISHSPEYSWLQQVRQNRSLHRESRAKMFDRLRNEMRIYLIRLGRFDKERDEYIVTFSDITLLERYRNELESQVAQRTGELKHAVETLEEYRKNLEFAQQLAHIGSFVWNIPQEQVPRSLWDSFFKKSIPMTSQP